MGKLKEKVEPVKRDGPYVMMLFITLVAIAIGCVLLQLDSDEYGSQKVPPEKAPSVQPLGQLAKTDTAPAATTPTTP